MEELKRQELDIECKQQQFRSMWAERDTAVLHQIVFRLVQIQATAALEEPRSLATGEATAVLEEPKSLVGDGAQPQPVHERWSDVELVACIRGSHQAVAGDFPVHSIFRTSTPLSLVNICEEDSGDSLWRMLRKLAEYLLHTFAHFRAAPLPLLIYVVTDVNVFFNEMPGAPLRGGVASARRFAAELAQRYEAAAAAGGDGFSSSGGPPGSPRPAPVVAAVERLCRRGVASPCDSEEARPPFLHAGGLAGPAETLLMLVHAMLVLGVEQGEAATLDASSLLRQAVARGSVEVVPDTRQLLFGSLTEVAQGACSPYAVGESGNSTNGVWCAPEPCCPISNSFGRLHEAFFANYRVEGCSLRRHDEPLPILWHGDGLAKWMYALALDGLAASCPHVARLVLANHPRNALEVLFARFEATQVPGSVATKQRFP